jgi:hypothetical protein
MILSTLYLSRLVDLKTGYFSLSVLLMALASVISDKKQTRKIFVTHGACLVASGLILLGIKNAPEYR